MKIIAAGVLAYLIASTFAHATGIEPLLLKPPVSPDVTLPKLLFDPMERFGAGIYSPAYFACIAFDIDTLGLVSSATLLKSSGNQDVDAQALKLARDSIYKPATRRGVLITARMMKIQFVRAPPGSDEPNRAQPACSWDLLKKLEAPSAPQIQPNTESPNYTARKKGVWPFRDPEGFRND